MGLQQLETRRYPMSAAAVSSASAVVCAGTLRKAPPIRSVDARSVRSWKRRFCALYNDNRPRLDYFKDEQAFVAQEKPKGGVSIKDFVAVKQLPAGATKHSHVFTVMTVTRQYFFSAPGKDELENWVKQIQRMLKSVHGELLVPRTESMLSRRGASEVPSVVTVAPKRRTTKSHKGVEAPSEDQSTAEDRHDGTGAESCGAASSAASSAAASPSRPSLKLQSTSSSATSIAEDFVRAKDAVSSDSDTEDEQAEPQPDVLPVYAQVKKRRRKKNETQSMVESSLIEQLAQQALGGQEVVPLEDDGPMYASVALSGGQEVVPLEDDDPMYASVALS